MDLFEKETLPLLENLAELNIRAVNATWEKSFAWGEEGLVLRTVINNNSKKAIKKLLKDYPYLEVYAKSYTYADLLLVWRLRKLAKATRKCKEEKLARLLAQAEYKKIYWLLSEDFYLTLKKTDCFLLYLRWYSWSILPAEANKKAIIRNYLRRGRKMYDQQALEEKTEQLFDLL